MPRSTKKFLPVLALILVTLGSQTVVQEMICLKCTGGALMESTFLRIQCNCVAAEGHHHDSLHHPAPSPEKRDRVEIQFPHDCCLDIPLSAFLLQPFPAFDIYIHPMGFHGFKVAPCTSTGSLPPSRDTGIPPPSNFDFSPPPLPGLLAVQIC